MGNNLRLKIDMAQFVLCLSSFVFLGEFSNLSGPQFFSPINFIVLSRPYPQSIRKICECVCACVRSYIFNIKYHL